MFAMHPSLPEVAEADGEAVDASRRPRCDRFVTAELADGDPRRARRESRGGPPDRVMSFPRVASERARRIARTPTVAPDVAG